MGEHGNNAYYLVKAAGNKIIYIVRFKIFFSQNEFEKNPTCVCLLFTIAHLFLNLKRILYCIPYKIISFCKQISIFVTSNPAILFRHNGHKIFIQLEYNIKDSYVCLLLQRFCKQVPILYKYSNKLFRCLFTNWSPTYQAHFKRFC